ncbi:MAG: Tad domain-containing protein [Gammaproteobacteria bacterium]
MRLSVQRGQAAFMTLILAVVMVLGGLSLYRAGRMTANKMELQNAADAMAYGVSTVEARDLNFAAYTNRAIIANEVAIGQAIGMASWAYHWKSIGDFLLEYNKFLSGPTLGISNSILPPMATPFQVSGGLFVTMMRAYAKAMTAVNHNINKIYGISQQIYHLASVVNTLGLLDKAIKDNAPDEAHMSGYGVMMLLSHLATYGGLPTRGIIDHLPSMVADQLEPFTRSYDPDAEGTPIGEWQADIAGDTDAGGYGRLAAMIHNSGDPFTKGFVNPPDDANPNLTGRGWTINFFDILKDAMFPSGPLEFDFLPAPFIGEMSVGVFNNPVPPRATGPGWLGFRMNAGVDFGIVGADVEYYMYIRMRLVREGGSELRLAVPLSGSNADKAAGSGFSWSSADTTDFDLGFAGGGGFDAWIRLPFIGKIDLLSASVTLVVADNNMFAGFSFGGGGTGCSDPLTDDDPDNDDEEPQCEDASGSADIEIYDGPFPTSAPLGAAFVHSGRPTGPTPNALTSTPEHMGTEAMGGTVPGEAYGTAAENLIAWYYPPSMPAAGIFFQPTLPDRNVTQAYRGLPRYIDTTESAALFGSGGPFLLVGLTLDEEDFTDSLYALNPGKRPAGRFALDEGFADGSMSAVAKSEVHFKRPLDLDYFARGDGYVEHGSAFNPYWQAHLTETSHADRVMALLLQHGELAQGISFDDDTDSLLTWLSDALGL